MKGQTAIMVEAHKKKFRIMVEDIETPSVISMKRPKQPVSNKQTFNNVKRSGNTWEDTPIFDDFESAEKFAKRIEKSELCIGVWQFFPNPEYISNR